MRLRTLLQHLDLTLAESAPDLEITGVQDDSRLVAPGDLFIARGGPNTDGAQFAADAAARGAVAVVTDKQLSNLALPQIYVVDASVVGPQLATAFAGHPERVVKLLGVTGTNGKTTVAYLVRHILDVAGRKCGMIGTVEIDDGAKRVESALTTPGAIQLANLLAAMRDNGCRACVTEASSHALHQNRLAGLEFAAAGFTNLTGDHLDYHKSMDAYAAAKARLFETLPHNAVAATNADSPWYRRMIERTDARIVTFGIQQPADYRAADFAVTAHGTHFVLVTPDGKTEIDLQLIGRHNIENALCAITMCCETFGMSVQQVAAALKTAKGAPGRLELVGTGRPFSVLVDYAHTDDALHNVLSALRPLTRGKLRVVFGCGGDRDRTKRPRMARVAEQGADVVYVTSDNPRTEDPDAILAEIRDGFTSAARKHVAFELDRRVAIERAIYDSQPGDVVLIAGKGHENYQILGKTKHHFDDVEEARNALTSLGHQVGAV